MLILLPATTLGLAFLWKEAGWRPSAVVSVPFWALALCFLWVAFVRPRLEVFEEGVRVVNPFTSRSIAWGDIRHFDANIHSLVIYETGGRVTPVPGLPAVGLRRIFGKAGRVDVLATSLNARVGPSGASHVLFIHTEDGSKRLREYGRAQLFLSLVLLAFIIVDIFI